MKRIGNTNFRKATKSVATLIALALLGVGGAAAHADNPVVQTNFTADPAPMVHDGVVYLYTSHDEESAPVGMGGFRMLDWKCYTSTDMVNWTDHGSIASLKTFPWAVQGNDAWAPQVVERDGKFYLYAPVSVPGWPKNVIAVAVADNPLGPFKDALGHPLINKANGYIDPTVFVDDDGQAYLYWGNPNLWCVKLNKDMISYSGEIMQIASKPRNYQEGPWFYKRNGHYYLAYASTCCPEGIGYAMSESAMGPWTYKDYIMEPDGRSSGNHPGIIDYKGNSYVFGFNYQLNFALTKEHHERRSVCVEKLTYNPDGSIVKLPWWQKDGAPQLGTFNPYNRTEAETICWSEKVKTEPCSAGGLDVTNIQNGSYIKVKGADFGAGASTFQAWVATGGKGGNIEVRLDSPTGPLVGTCAVGNTGGSQNWVGVSCPITGATGVHDLYFVFTGGDEMLFNFDWWKFDAVNGAPKI